MFLMKDFRVNMKRSRDRGYHFLVKLCMFIGSEKDPFNLTFNVGCGYRGELGLHFKIKPYLGNSSLHVVPKPPC